MAASQEADHDPQTGPPRFHQAAVDGIRGGRGLGLGGLRFTSHAGRCDRDPARRADAHAASDRHGHPADGACRRGSAYGSRREYHRRPDRRTGPTDCSAGNRGRRLPGRRRGAGADPAELTRRAIAALGGIERFVKPGANVIVKPNICNAYHGPEYASTTNPDVVAAIVALCLGAGAKRVRVMDFPFGGSPQASYETSGIAAAVKAAGGEMEAMNRLKFRKTAIPQGKILRSSNIYGDILDADTVINVPIAKTHGSATLTLGMKNLMGVIQDRNTLHASGLHQAIADLNSAVKPQLTIVDAVRILTANGPTGGNLDDVKRLDTIIASADVVAADAYATGLFGMKPADVKYIKLGAEMGLGTMDLGNIRIEEIAVCKRVRDE